MRVGQPVKLTADLYGNEDPLSRHGGRLRRGHRLGVLVAAGAERDRQLDQDRAARAGTHCARSARARGEPAADRSVHEGRSRRRTTAMACACRSWRATPSPVRRMSTVRRMRRPMRGCTRSLPPTDPGAARGRGNRTGATRYGGQRALPAGGRTWLRPPRHAQEPGGGGPECCTDR